MRASVRRLWAALTGRGVYLGLVLLGAFSIAYVGWQTREVSLQINQIALQNCREIEALKLQNRADALRDFARLDENLEVLNIRKTPQIVALAERNRDEKLDRNKPRSCERGPFK